jgi:predicted GNAT family acetyltransferase
MAIDEAPTTATDAPQVRELGADDLPALRSLLERNPVRHCFVADRVNATMVQSWRLGGLMWGYFTEGRLVSACFNGANLVPVEATAGALQAFADRARRYGRHCSSIVGSQEEVAALWRLLEPSWGPARSERLDQPVMSIASSPTVAPDPRVRVVRPDELDLYLPACSAMFTEEVGVPPTAGESEESYRQRIAELIAQGRALARIEDGRVVFKAEVGSVAGGVCQIVGVWVDPALRGRGLSVGAMAATIEYARIEFAPTVSLYVNAYNTAARRSYLAAGMTQTDTFASVLF